MYLLFRLLLFAVLLTVVAGCSSKPAVVWDGAAPICPYCRQGVPMKSTACPRCGHDYRWEAITCPYCKGTRKLTCVPCEGTGSQKTVVCTNCVDGFVLKVSDFGRWKLRVPGEYVPKHYGEQIGELADAEYTEKQNQSLRANHPAWSPYKMDSWEHAYRCPRCQGTGRRDEPCETCGGTGKLPCDTCDENRKVGA
jgi:hypothetical protein